MIYHGVLGRSSFRLNIVIYHIKENGCKSTIIIINSNYCINKSLKFLYIKYCSKPDWKRVWERGERVWKNRIHLVVPDDSTLYGPCQVTTKPLRWKMTMALSKANGIQPWRKITWPSRLKANTLGQRPNTWETTSKVKTWTDQMINSNQQRKDSWISEYGISRTLGTGLKK